MSSFALITDLNGQIERCLYDDTRAQLGAQMGEDFSIVYGTLVADEIGGFLITLRTTEASGHIEVNDPIHEDARLLISGSRWEEHLILTGVSYLPGLSRETFDELMRINNQQLNMVRSMAKQLSLDTAQSGGDVVSGTVQDQEAQRRLGLINNELNRQLRQMALLNRMNSALQMCNTLDEIYKVIGMFTERLFNSIGGSLFIFRPDVNKFEIRARWGLGEDREALRKPGQGFIDLLNQQTSQQKITGFLLEQTSADCLLLRIPEDRTLVGVLQIRLSRKISTSDPFFSQYQQIFLRLIGLAIANMQYREWLEQDAMVDHLTKLYNHRFLSQQLAREVSRATRQGAFLSIVLIDLDGFSAVNQDFGHLIGDQYLIEFAKILTNCVRKEDYACRYGEDEFALLLVESTKQDALMILGRIKASCKFVRVSDRTLTIPFSSGVSTFPTDGKTPEEILTHVGEVLYIMKRRKRQRR